MDTNQIIKDKYRELPEDIQNAIKSSDLPAKFENIAQKHGLHIDQNGSLQTETLLVMLGLQSSDDFVPNVEKALEIPEDAAFAIAQDINTEIFDSIRSSLQEIQAREEAESEANEEKVETDTIKETVVPINREANPATAPVNPTPFINKTAPVVSQAPSYIAPIASVPPTPKPATIEQAGGFTVEKPVQKSEPIQYNKVTINKDNILKGIENPEEIKQGAKSAEPISMIDHLLSAPTDKIVPTPAPQPSSPAPAVPSSPVMPVAEKKPYTADPYREPI